MKNYIWTFNTLVDYELVSAHWNKKRLPRHDVTYHSHTHRIKKAHSNDKQRFRKSFEQTKPYSYSLIEHHHSPAFASHVRCDKKAGDERLQQPCVTYQPITLHLEHPFVMNIFVYTSWIIQISVFAEPCCWASAPNKELWWTYHYRKFICSDVRLRFVVTYPNSVRDFLLKYLIIIIIREGE